MSIIIIILQKRIAKYYKKNCKIIFASFAKKVEKTKKYKKVINRSKHLNKKRRKKGIGLKQEKNKQVDTSTEEMTDLKVIRHFSRRL